MRVISPQPWIGNSYMQMETGEYSAHDKVRIEIARRIVERKKQELGEHLIIDVVWEQTKTWGAPEE